MAEHERCRRCLWEDDMIKEKKIEIVTAMAHHQEISRKVAEVLLLKQRVCLLQAALQEQRDTFDIITRDLEIIRKSNNRREEKCKKAKSRDFDKKFIHAESECHRKRFVLNEEKQQLAALRKNFITQLMKRVFPISLSTIASDEQQVPHVSEDLHVGSNNDYFEHVERPQESTFHYFVPLHHIGHGTLPANGTMTDYIRAVKLKKEISDPTPVTSNNEYTEINQLNDLVMSVPAALSFVTHSIWIIATILDQVLPHSLLLPVVLCEYGRSDRKAQTIVRFLAKLDDIIMFLAFTQNVLPESLTVGHTLKNLSVLINHHELGRCGPFTCYPELLHYPIVSRRYKLTSDHDYTAVDWESEPPLLHTAQSPPDNSPHETDSESDSEDNDTIVDGWEEVHDLMVPTNFLAGFQGERLEYGTSCSEYSHQTVLNESEHQEISSSTQYSSGLMDTISSLFGSNWTKK